MGICRDLKKKPIKVWNKIYYHFGTLIKKKWICFWRKKRIGHLFFLVSGIRAHTQFINYGPAGCLTNFFLNLKPLVALGAGKHQKNKLTFIVTQIESPSFHFYSHHQSSLNSRLTLFTNKPPNWNKNQFRIHR